MDGFGLALTGPENDDDDGILPGEDEDDGGQSVFEAAKKSAPLPRMGEENLIDLPIDEPQTPPVHAAGGGASFAHGNAVYAGGPPSIVRNRKTVRGQGTYFPWPGPAPPPLSYRAGPEAARNKKPTVFIWLCARWCVVWVAAWRICKFFVGAFVFRPTQAVKRWIAGAVLAAHEDAGVVGRVVQAAKRNKKQLVGAAYCSAMSTAFLGALLFLTADFTVTANDLRANGGKADIVAWATSKTSNFSRPSTTFTCGEVRDRVVLRKDEDGPGDGSDPYNDGVQSSFFSTLAQAEKVISPKGPLQAPCACAPMFGLKRRHIAVMAQGKPLHMFNARLVRGGDEGGAEEPLFSRVLEHQRMLFPEKSDSVYNVRRDVIWLEFLRRQEGPGQGASCENGRVRLRGNEARCAQACLDLFDGVSVYDRYKEQEKRKQQMNNAA